MSRPDPAVVSNLIQSIQRETEAEVQQIYRQAHMKKYQRAIEAGYDLCLQHYKLGKYAETK